jgi:hypothetical protein
MRKIYFFACLLFLFLNKSFAQTISLTSGTYSQDFNTLLNTGTTNNLAINGWLMTESGGGARDNEQYAADNGGSNTGDSYSYGTISSTERALGGLRSGTLIPIFGAAFTNNSGTTITSLTISYTGEQWRAGVLNRNAADRIDFQISTNATSVGDAAATWTDVNDLDFNSPNILAAAGALDGNSPGNRSAISFTITGLSIANGATFYIRWTDFDIASSDDGLAIDDFSLSFDGTITSTVSVAAGNNAAEPATNGTFNISLSQPAPVGGVTVTYSFSGGATQNSDYTDPQAGTVTIAEGNTSTIVTVNVNDDPDIEGTETIQITLNTVTSPFTIATGTATINLTDNDVSPYVSLVATYSQDFNTLASSGTSSAVPQGWLFNETGTNANTLYTAGTGSGTSGDTYSFGAASNPDRAFGTLLTNAFTPAIGAQIQNNSGTTITKLKISYTGEEWRLGATDRADKLSFEYSLDATSLSNGTWTPVINLDFITPNFSAAAGVGAKDGNNITNRTSLVYTIRNLNIPSGAVFLIRWSDFNASGSDDGLSVDDFTIEANPVDLIPPVLNSVNPTNGATNVSINVSASAQFNEEVQKGTGNIRIRRMTDNSIFQTIDVNTPAVTVSSTSVHITLSNLEINTGYYIEIDNGAILDLDGNSFAGISASSTWSFTTGINIYVATFQTCTGGISDGFTQFSEVGSIVWGCTTFGHDPNDPLASLANGVQINGFSGGTNVPNTDWLISPSFDLTGTTYPLLSFWSRTAFNGQPLQLKISTDYISGDPTLATWEDINGKFPGETSNIWMLSENINLSAFKQPNVHFAFVYHSSDDDGARWTADDIKLINSPTPPPPSLTVNATDIQFPYTANGNNTDKTFTFIGNDLTNDITVNATGPFTLSKDGFSFSSSLLYTIAEANNIFKTVYIRFAPPQNNQNFTGTITVASGSLSATINLSGTSIDPVTTLEVVNWNVEWFGSTVNGPANDDQQEQNIKTILQTLGADLYALAEVVSEPRLANVVSQMPGYAYVICNYGSHTNPNDGVVFPLSESQKLAFIYKTSVFSNISTAPLLSQGINSVADISNPAYDYWASGRFPFMLNADVTLNCITKNVKFILVHAKANTSPTIPSYNRRKKGADSLHYTLEQLYPNDNVVILGDYNDDLDSTITDGIHPAYTSYLAFRNDSVNYPALTLPLSYAGKKSTVTHDNVIDHVIVSGEMQPNYMSGTANVLTDVAGLVSNYGSTTTDHYPVFTRYIFTNTVAPEITTCPTVSPFCVNNTNTYTIPQFVATDDCGDVINYSYEITGATERSGVTNNASGTFNAGTSTITWKATDGWGNSSTCQTTVLVNVNPGVTIPDAFALPSGTLANTVYKGYAPASSITLTAVASGGAPTYTYNWSSGSTSASTTVSPLVATTYNVTITDANGCQATASKLINVMDIRGGKKLEKVLICHTQSGSPSTLTVSSSEVPTHLSHGDMLGACPAPSNMITGSTKEQIQITKLAVLAVPNPSSRGFTINIQSSNSEKMSLKVSDIFGRTIEVKNNISANHLLKFGDTYRPGIYLAEVMQGREKVILKLVKLND